MIKTGSYYRLSEPQWATVHGQGERPQGLRIAIDGDSITIPWSATVRASSQVSGLGNMDHDPPLVKTHLLQEFEHQFTPVEV